MEAGSASCRLATFRMHHLCQALRPHHASRRYLWWASMPLDSEPLSTSHQEQPVLWLQPQPRRRCSPTEGSGFRSPRWSPLGRCGGRTAKENPLHSPQEEPVSPDVLVNNVGTLYTFCPLTLQAKEWIDAHVQDDAQWFGHALIVEHRYAWGLAQGMKDDGLVLE